MRGAFIVRLGPETQPSEGRFEGWVQEVDLCCEQRFRSGEELLKFLGERFAVCKAVTQEARTGQQDGSTAPKKKRCKDKANP